MSTGSSAGPRTPRALVLSGDSLGGAQETALALALARFDVQVESLGALIRRQVTLDALSSRFQVLAIPGGFSFGDHLGAGKVLALKLRHALGWDLARFAGRGGLVLGIGNGFQALIKLGLFARDISITLNDQGRFRTEWVRLQPFGNRCVWTRGMGSLDLPIRHSEGRVVIASSARLEVWARMERVGMACLRYEGDPNGSEERIAGLCDPSGRIFGLMPHPENFVRWTQYPEWTAQPGRANSPGQGLLFFENAYLEALKSL
ncbi:MAG: phosphoribosylformylglycinamidine synthase subunit PurQ [Oligoflexia bacterium]|jgi:phosphoribosylformylglycinamidine (FGAM) synthase-like amidotransferase family enzyme